MRRASKLPALITGLIAPNGAGKTTLLEALVALGPTRRAGSVHANGVASAQAAFRKLVLYVPCDAGLLYPNLTAADHIKLAAALWPDKVDTAKLIELCGLAGYLNKPVRAYSSGMKQQLALAVAYCTGARYLAARRAHERARSRQRGAQLLHHEALGGARDEYPVVIAYLVQPR